MLFLRLSGDNIQKWFLRPDFKSTVSALTNKFPHIVSSSEVSGASGTFVY